MAIIIIIITSPNPAIASYAIGKGGPHGQYKVCA
jgi:hypothetical protein